MSGTPNTGMFSEYRCAYCNQGLMPEESHRSINFIFKDDVVYKANFCGMSMTYSYTTIKRRAYVSEIYCLHMLILKNLELRNIDHQTAGLICQMDLRDGLDVDLSALTTLEKFRRSLWSPREFCYSDPPVRVLGSKPIYAYMFDDSGCHLLQRQSGLTSKGSYLISFLATRYSDNRAYDPTVLSITGRMSCTHTVVFTDYPLDDIVASSMDLDDFSKDLEAAIENE